jgi:hypothetical protein
MTDEAAIEQRKAREAKVDQILDLALDLTIARLKNVTPAEIEDNMSFDRLARTAQVLFRIVDEAHALVARQRKEQIANDQSGAGAEEAASIERTAVELERRLNEEIDRLTGGGAAREVSRAVAKFGAGEGR